MASSTKPGTWRAGVRRRGARRGARRTGRLGERPCLEKWLGVSDQ